MRYHLFQKFFGKMVKIKETSFLSTREDTNFVPPLYQVQAYPYSRLTTYMNVSLVFSKSAEEYVKFVLAMETK